MADTLTYDEVFERWGEAALRCRALETWQATARDFLGEFRLRLEAAVINGDAGDKVLLEDLVQLLVEG